MRLLRAQPLAVAAFAPFGSVVEPAVSGLVVNAGTSARSEAVPALDPQRDGGRAVLAVYLAQARRLPFDAMVLERHRLSDQVFLPLAGARRCVLLVAPASVPHPGAGDCVAFVTDGRQGVRIAAGTWHHGLLALDEGPWAVLERRGEALDCEEVRLERPVRLSVQGWGDLPAQPFAARRNERRQGPPEKVFSHKPST
jgi:ureidoglycolate lyase